MEIAVIGPQTTLVLPVGLRWMVGGDDGEDKIRVRPAVAVDDLLYTALYLHDDLLSGLETLLDDQTVPNLFFAQKCHVDKWHALGVETK